MSVMDETTLEALKGSIEKWQKIVDGTEVDESTWNCPLCREFFRNGCRGCPIQHHTKKVACLDTPYTNWSEVAGELPANDSNGYTHTPESLAAAKAELKFLQSLLPSP